MRKLLQTFCLTLAALASLSFCAPLSAQELVGRIKRLSGTVSVERAGKTLPLEPSSPLFQGDRIRTGRDGYAGITLVDDTLLTAGPGSLLVLSRFAFNATTQEGELQANLPHGSLQVVSGLIAKKSPEKVQFKGRNIVLGVRGTEFILDVPGTEE
ncbi:MAG TPA: FecR domain-containing protein [Burkholderiaceae bacterium]|jgi:hypothetical protein